MPPSPPFETWPQLLDIEVPPHVSLPFTGECPAFSRPPERWDDVILSVQAAWSCYCNPRKGCAHTPLELYESVEIALWFADYEPCEQHGRPWITRPSQQLGIDGFDEVWNGDVVAGWVPLAVVGRLQRELALRARRRSGEVAHVP